MRLLFLCILFCSFPTFAQVVDPIPAIPITDGFLSDTMIRGYFADVLEQGGFGHWKTERAAFLVRDEGGQYHCVAWPLDGRLQRQEFRGAIPDRTVAIIHTHPAELPLRSTGDQRTAVKLSVPTFVLTPLNIYMITRGVSDPVVENRQWATFSASSSIRCSAPDENQTVAKRPVTAAVADESNSGKRYSITVAEPLKLVLDDRTALNIPCRTIKPIYGCTLFAEEYLSCLCEREGNRWRFLAKARFVPIMYLYGRRPDLVSHEQLHIDDVRAMLADYLESLTSREFTTEEGCSQHAQTASEQITFVRRMNDFRRQSNKKLD